MKITKISQSLTIIFSVITTTALAEEQHKNNIDVITIKAPKLSLSDTAFAEGNLVMPDVADWLKTVPGANINKMVPLLALHNIVACLAIEYRKT